MANIISLAVLCQLLVHSASLQQVPQWSVLASKYNRCLYSTPGASNTDTIPLHSENDTRCNEKNTLYVQGLLENLTSLLDKWIINGSPSTRTSAYNLVKQIEREAIDEGLVLQAKRMVRRAGMPLANESKEKQLGRTDTEKRRQQAEERKKWESTRSSKVGSEISSSLESRSGRSALSRRAAPGSKPDLFLQNVDRRLDPHSVADDKTSLEKLMKENEERHNDIEVARAEVRDKEASTKISEIIAQAGAGDAFEGERLGIGGLDDVLSQIKRRVWTPLAAPPQLLEELGIRPVRGLLLFGRPGCGKTLMARIIGQILSPARPITVVAGPAIMDKFVGSSEKNLREIFDNPPDIYDTFRIGESDGGDSVADHALHVVIMDEFDAIARTRGGRGGGQGDAGVARDSLVNQLLTCLDGVEPPVVPTFVIGLTNKRSLIDPALLRPGRFEVQIEVPPPRTNSQRKSILRVHTKNMFTAGRVLVKDAPHGTAAARFIEEHECQDLVTYEELLQQLANECDGMSGASLAGVARAAASHALERVVDEYSKAISEKESSSIFMMDCLVTREDFESAINDVNESTGDSDWEMTEEEEGAKLARSHDAQDARSDENVDM